MTDSHGEVFSSFFSFLQQHGRAFTLPPPLVGHRHHHLCQVASSAKDTFLSQILVLHRHMSVTYTVLSRLAGSLLPCEMYPLSQYTWTYEFWILHPPFIAHTAHGVHTCHLSSCDIFCHFSIIPPLNFLLLESRAGVDGVEQEINDWASELNFIQVSMEYTWPGHWAKNF